MSDRVTIQNTVECVLDDITAAGSYPLTQQTITPTAVSCTNGTAPVSGSPATLTYSGVTSPLGVWIYYTEETNTSAHITLKVGTTTQFSALYNGDPPMYIANPEAITIASSSGSLTVAYQVVAWTGTRS